MSRVDVDVVAVRPVSSVSVLHASDPPRSFREALRRFLRFLLLVLEDDDGRLPQATSTSGGPLWPEEQPALAAQTGGRWSGLDEGRRAR